MSTQDQLFQRIERVSSAFERVWRIPFEQDSDVSKSFIMEHIKHVLGGDCWAAWTQHDILFNLYNNETTHYDIIRENLLYDPLPLINQQDTVYIVMGAVPFRYLTIEYTDKGLGILSDFQRSDDV